MSVLLTATKNVWKRNAAKPKKKRRSSSSTSSPSPAECRDFDATPPMSNARTTVWYWCLDGVSTTLMYSRETQEVWCNGIVLDTEGKFSENADVIHFTIRLEELGTSYRCRLVRRPLATTGTGPGCFRLFVDRTPIMEHAVDAAQRVGVPDELYGRMNVSALSPDPPAYVETVAEDAMDDTLPPYDE